MVYIYKRTKVLLTVKSNLFFIKRVFIQFQAIVQHYCTAYSICLMSQSKQFMWHYYSFDFIYCCARRYFSGIMQLIGP